MIRTPDPGSRSIALVCWAAVVVLFSVLVLWQQGIIGQPKGHTGPAPAVQPPEQTTELMSRMWVKLAAADRSALAPGTLNERLIRNQMEAASQFEAERVRMAIVAIEIFGAKEIEPRLADLEQVVRTPELRADVEVLRAIYSGSPPEPDSKPAQTLREHHRFYGDLALSYGLPETDPLRERLTGGAGMLMLVLTAVCGYVLVIVLGCILLLTAFILFLTGKLRFRFVPAAPGGSLGIEVFIAFLVGFLLLKVVAHIVATTVNPEAGMTVSFALQWLLALVILYPMLRGYPLRESWERLGFHRGTGVFREIGAGILGYIASLPLLIAGLVVSLVLMALWGMFAPQSEPTTLPQNDLLELVGKLSWWKLLLLASLALIWAPLVEEFVFRGGLLRDLSSRVWLIVAAVGTSFFFAFAHGYPVLLLPVLMGLATGFAFIRFWRGSIIACITAHCIHNTFALTMLYLLTRSVG